MTKARKVKHLTNGVRALLFFAACLVCVSGFMSYQGKTEKLRKEASVSARFIMASQEAGTGMLEVRAKSGEIVFADPIAEKIFGYQPGEMVGLPVSNLMTGIAAERHQTGLEAAIGRLSVDPKAPKVLVTPCSALRKNNSLINVVVRAYLSTHDDTLFAAVNALTDVVWHPVSTPTGEHASTPAEEDDKAFAN